MEQKDIEIREEIQNFNLFLQLKFVPQVLLLLVNDNFSQSEINLILKKIVCQKQFCDDNQLCLNCQKLVNNYYFDLIKYQFNKNKLMKKDDVISIIDNLSLQSLELNNPKICLIEKIENSSLEASNSFLKFLENIPDNTFLILTTNKIDKVLPTIKSRCQIFNLIKNNDNYDFLINNLQLTVQEQQLIMNLIAEFIDYDNKKMFNQNFFSIKRMLNLNKKIIFFFQLLLSITINKLSLLNNLSISNDQIINNFISSWTNKDQLFLEKLIELLVEVINKCNDVNNLNLNLLLNYFFINIYQGTEDDNL